MSALGLFGELLICWK